MANVNVHGACNSETKCLDYTVGIPRNLEHVLTALGDPKLR
jgi:hypothetical protein